MILPEPPTKIIVDISSELINNPYHHLNMATAIAIGVGVAATAFFVRDFLSFNHYETADVHR